MRRSPTTALVAGIATLGVVLAGVSLAGPASAATKARTTRTALAAARPVAGKAVTLTATVSPKPTRGTVRFTASGKTLASCGARTVSRSTGKATCRTTFRTAGRRTVAARYSGASKRYKASLTSRSVTVSAAPVAKPAAVGTVVGGVGSCTTTKGALVAVSFGPWSGPVARGCGTTLTSGRALLTSGGFTLTNVRQFPGFICRIGTPLFAGGAQYPTSSQDACAVTPPASAYWSFWTAAKGATTWTYSSKGADTDVPVNGAVEAWTYGSTDVNGTTGQPSFTPAQVRSGLPTGTAVAARPAARQAVIRPAAAGASSPDIQGAVTYLENNLVDGNHLEAFPGTADIGLTIDAAYALAAAGQDATLSKLVDYVATNQNDYTSLSGPFKDYAGGQYVAKVALLAEMAGDNPRDFGGVDLIAGLDGLICPSASAANCAGTGNYVYSPSTFGQALGVLAQLRAGDSANAAKPIAFLEGLQNGQGAFPSVLPGTDSDVDSTAVAAMALSLVDTAAARADVTEALAWLAGRQTATGGFPGASGVSVNSAALAIQALRLDAGTYGTRIAKAEKFLAGAQNTDGGFDVASGVELSDVRASTQALGGAIGVPFGSVLDDLSAKDAGSAGADYLVGQLVDGDHYETAFGGQSYADQGLTADGVFALVGTGGHAAAVTKMVTYLKGQVDAYADVSGAFGGPYSGSLAKLSLVAEATGADPHSFGGADLLKILADHVCTAAATDGTCTAAGDFVSAYSPVSQALGVLALQASPVAADHLTAHSAPVERLHQLQCADGGFTSDLITPGATCTSDVDTTGYAVQALTAVPGTDAWLGKAQAYLQATQKSSGLYPGASGDNSNSTAYAAQALQTLVTALYSPTTDQPGHKLVTPITTWQSALHGLVSLSLAKGGFALTAGGTADLRASTQAVAAVSQRSLFAVSGAAIASTPRAAATSGGGSGGGTGGGSGTPTSGAPTGGGSSSSGSAAGGSSTGSGHAPDGSGTPITGSQASGTANTGVPTLALLGWAALLLLLGSLLTVGGRRRVFAVVGRHRDARRH